MAKSKTAILSKFRSLLNENSSYDSILPKLKDNFLEGMGSVLSVDGSYFGRKSPIADQIADRRAIASDWMSVGRDIKTAKKDFEKNNLSKFSVK